MSMYDMVDMAPEGVSEGAALSGMFGEELAKEAESGTLGSIYGAEQEIGRGIETITEEILSYKRRLSKSADACGFGSLESPGITGFKPC